MRKKKLFYAGILALAFLCACNKEEGREKLIMTPTPIPEATVAPTSTPRPTPTEAARQIGEQYLVTLETVDWTELDFCADEELSMRNSNLLNQGFVTYDENGNLYYSDRRGGGIYVSDYKGENMRLLAEEEGVWLQIKGEWLYFNSTECGIDRINIVTEEREHLYEETCGEFIVTGEKLFINTPDGLKLLDLHNKEAETILQREEIGFSNMSSGITDTCFLANVADKATGEYELLRKGYLVYFDGEQLRLINQKGMFPLVAGRCLSVIDEELGLRHIWNLETKEDIDLEAWTNRTVVSDGKDFYYKETKVFDPTLEEGELSPGLDTCIYHWDGEKTEAIWMIESDNLYEMYLTPTALYCTPQMKIDGKSGYHLLYYILETGETGVIY